MRVTSLFGAVALLAATPALAHHSFAMYDQSREITITGAVSEFQWTNPHCWIELEVMNSAGKVEHWSVESGSIHSLTSIGWKSKYVKIGDKVTVSLNPMKDGSRGGAVQSIIFADGKKIVGGGR